MIKTLTNGLFARLRGHLGFGSAGAIKRIAGRMARHQGGIAAAEFALILPLMLIVYLGTVEVSQGLSIDRKLTLAVRTVADLSSRAAAVNNSEMKNILNASVAIMSPYPTNDMTLTVSAVSIDSDGRAKVAWSDTRNGTKRQVGETVPVPDALKVPNTTLIWSEGTYKYTPMFGYVITGTLTFDEHLYMSPRLSDTVTRGP